MSDPKQGHAIERLVVGLGAALQQRAVYPPGHPQLVRAIAAAAEAHEAMLAASGERETAIMVVEERLLVDRRPVPEEATWSLALLGWLIRLGISGLTVSAGFDQAELSAFLDGCQRPEGPSPSAHLVIGRVGFTGDEAVGEEAAVRARALVEPEVLERARAGLLAVAAGRARDLDPLRALVSALARAAGAVQAPRLPVASAEDRAFLHGLTTAAGTLRLARALGLDGEPAEELSLAGLLHDVGRLPAGDDAGGGGGGSERLPLEHHPSLGAARIAAVAGAPDLAVVVAYEHHLRVDARPNYPRLATARPPGAPARVVAVADTWDTLRSRGGVRPDEALTLLRERAGTFLDPAVVEVWAALVASPG